MKITDNDLSCQQLYDERNEMEMIAADAKITQFSGQTAGAAGQAASDASAPARPPAGGVPNIAAAAASSAAAAKAAPRSGQHPPRLPLALCRPERPP